VNARRFKVGLKWGGLCVVVWLMLRWFEHRQVYIPGRVMERPGRDWGQAVEDVWFTTSDGVKINAWFAPARTSSPRAKMAVLVCHGNAGNVSHRGPLVQALLSTGANVLVFDYRGYGRSEGRPGEAGTYRDARAAFDWLTNRGFAATNIIAYGESLGGGIASELAEHQPLGGLVLQSAFTSVPDIGAELFPWLPVRLLATIHYPTKDRLPMITAPVLVMHSRTDDIIGFHHGQTNFAVAHSPKLFWELNGDHNGALDDPKPFIEGMEKFLSLIETRGSAPEPAGGVRQQ
jgi:pimeloyl-ACP methyl ester carboxylesterase